MIRIKIYKDELGSIKKYTIKGHANYSSHGEDIVCAAISVLSQTALISLVEICGVDEKELKYIIDDNLGYLDVNLPKSLNKTILDKTQIVLKTLEIGIGSVIESYPKYVTLEYGEV